MSKRRAGNKVSITTHDGRTMLFAPGEPVFVIAGRDDTRLCERMAIAENVRPGNWFHVIDSFKRADRDYDLALVSSVDLTEDCT